MRSRNPANRRSGLRDRFARKQQPAATGPGVAKRSSGVGAAGPLLRRGSTRAERDDVRSKAIVLASAARRARVG